MTTIYVTKDEMEWLMSDRHEMVCDDRELKVEGTTEYAVELSGGDSKLQDLNDQLNWNGPLNTSTHSRY